MARLFLIAEPASNGDPEAPYRAGFVSVSRESDSRPADQMTFVDQVDLTPDAYDEVVVASRMRDGTQYLVLQRRDAGWMEIFASDVVTLPALQPGG
jgi:hypothetical protein